MVMIGAALIGVVSAFVGTRILAKDEYLTFWRSDLRLNVKELKAVCESGYQQPSPELINLLQAYQDWSQLLEKRTKPRTYAKMSTVGLILGSCGAFAFRFRPLATIALIGATASGCYWYYDHLTSRKRLTEREALKELRKSVQELKQTLENEPGASLFQPKEQIKNPPPSAPSSSDLN